MYFTLLLVVERAHHTPTRASLAMHPDRYWPIYYTTETTNQEGRGYIGSLERRLMRTFRALRSKMVQLSPFGLGTEQVEVELFWSRYYGDDPLLKKAYKVCMESC